MFCLTRKRYFSLIFTETLCPKSKFKLKKALKSPEQISKLRATRKYRNLRLHLRILTENKIASKLCARVLHSLSTALSFLCTVQCFAPFALRTLCSSQSVFVSLFLRFSLSGLYRWYGNLTRSAMIPAPPYQSPRTYRTNLLPSPPAKPQLTKLQTHKSANPVSDAGYSARITASEESHLALKHKYSVMHLLYTARIFLSIHTVSHIHDC